MGGPTNEYSGFRRWHGLLEHDTPDGALGRLLLAALALPVTASGLSLGILGILSFTVGGLLAGLVGAGVGLAAAVLTAVTLWPVYLSLIGNVESARAYTAAHETSRTDARDDPEAVLKRQYARGDISEAEFERRLDGLLEADADRSRRERVDDRTAVDTSRERERT